MQSYESIFITPADLPTQQLDDFLEKFKSLVTKAGGQITNVDKWGRRRLTYPIKRHREGFYVLVIFQAPPTVLQELTQFYRVTDQVIRHMTCKAVRVRPGRYGEPGRGLPTAAAAAAPSQAPQEVSHEHPNPAPAPAQ